MSRTVQPVDPLILLRVEDAWPMMVGESAPIGDTSTTVEHQSPPPDLSSFFKTVTDAGFDGVEVVSSVAEAGGVTESSALSKKVVPLPAPQLGKEGRKQDDLSGNGTRPTDPAESGLRVGAVSAVCPTIDPCEAVEATATLVAQAESCGARCLNLRIAPLVGFGVRDGFGGYQDAVNFVHVLLREIRPVVESAGVALAIEAARGGVLLSPVEMRDLIDGANSPALGVCLDVPTLTRVGSPLDWIETLQGLVHAVRVAGDLDTGAGRISDNRLGAGKDAGAGAGTAVAQLATSLREQSFGGVWIVAPARGEIITADSPASRIAHQVRSALGSHIAQRNAREGTP